MSYLTLSQASKETGKSKGTISKALKNGTLSYVEKTDAGYKIDPSELFRVYPRNPDKPLQNEQLATPSLPHAATPQELALLREMLEREREINKELRQDLDSEREERHRLTLRLEHTAKKKKFFGIF